MTKDTIAGAIREAGGKVRTKLGQALGDKKGAALGMKDRVAGNIQKNAGRLSDRLDD